VREAVKRRLESVKLKNLQEAVTTERLVKTQAGKYIAGAVVICEFWRLAAAL
jgi:hypothetical protein